MEQRLTLSRTVRALFALLFGLITTAVTGCGDDPRNNALLTILNEENQTYAELVRRIGPPDGEHTVDPISPYDPCGLIDGRANKWLEYGLPRYGTEAAVRRRLGMPHSQAVVVCLDSSERVAGTVFVEID